MRHTLRLAMLLAILGVIGSVASVIGLYAIYDSRRNRRIKRLVYQATRALPLAAAAAPDREYSLSIHYRVAGSETEEVIEAAYVRYVRFANFGKEPIRREDIAPANPLRIEVEGSRMLDIALAAAGRDVTQVRLEDAAIRSDLAAARISFDFLDHHDGAVIRVLSTGPRTTIRLVGDVIGMPSGIVDIDAVPARSWWGKAGFALLIVAELAALFAAAWVIQEVTGSWNDIWLLAVPLAAFFLPIAVAVVVSDLWWPPPRRRFPEGLKLPSWFGPGHPVTYVRDGERVQWMPLVERVADPPATEGASEGPRN